MAKKRWLALGVACLLAGSMLAGCGEKDSAADKKEATVTAQDEATADPAASDSAQNADADQPEDEADTAKTEEEPQEKERRSTTVSMLVSGNNATAFYPELGDNPTLRYFNGLYFDVDGTDVNVQFELTAPPAGGESDYINTLLATREYPAVMTLSRSSMSAAELYAEGIAIDLTEYVEKYMPNYRAWMAAHPEAAASMTNNVDGRRGYIQLYEVADAQEANFGGYMYRRDWLASYGTNPKTGEAFTGGYDENDAWTDDVVFPSGGSDPIYISDWEWMFEIFDKAMEDLGITDGYCAQMYYPGYIRTGDFCSGFGGINATWYIDSDGQARFGADSDAFRAYVECMHTWYENGWLDPQFEERSSELFFNIDNPAKMAGKVGSWYGVKVNLGDGMRGEDPLTQNICVYAAPQPVNDVYGDKSAQNVNPTCYVAPGLANTPYIITSHAAEEDIAAICTAFDHLYSFEGGCLRSFGFSDQIQKEVQDPFYDEQGMPDGSYVLTEKDGETLPYVSSLIDSVENLRNALQLQMPGLRVTRTLQDRSEYLSHALDVWTMYPASGAIDGTLSGQLSLEESEYGAEITTQIDTYMSQAVGDFITGRTDVEDDNAWQQYCDSFFAFHPEVYTEYLNSVLK